MDNLDIKSLKVLLNLYTTCNTYHTAEQMDLSQSSVARILAKCRQALNDPLFIRSGIQLVPTAYADTLAEKLPTIINQYEDAVTNHKDFKIGELTGRYQLFLSHPAQLVYGVKLFELLNKSAPNATWYIKGWESTSVEQLLDGSALIGVNYYASNFPNSIIQYPVCDDDFLILATHDHALHKKQNITFRDIAEYPFISLTIPSWDERNRYLDNAFQSIEKSPKISLQTDSIHLGIQVAQTSNMLLTASKRMANEFTAVLSPLNFEIETALLPTAQVVCSFSRKNANKPLVKWLKKQICQLASS
ncbi:LysR family transcriptional regulator [Psychromonas marina]|uniref:LysR family transcriptional regulator n=1 Tax=Psychromonas marina TaxID=88364 RepID=A0ABQ6E403_9GAMM|nr:LysR family transcriptional regulator [Psychromonas marina]GLS92111.1 LysR family transcriptional regulator [Psychromonas marina]